MPEFLAASTGRSSAGQPKGDEQAGARGEDVDIGGDPGGGAHGLGAAGVKNPMQRVRTRSWDEMVQMSVGEMPYLPSYPEHTAFERMWV